MEWTWVGPKGNQDRSHPDAEAEVSFFPARVCSHYWGGWRCERKSGQTKPGLKAVAGPPSRARMKYGPIVAATLRTGANFPHFGVDRR